MPLASKRYGETVGAISTKIQTSDLPQFAIKVKNLTLNFQAPEDRD
jgi:hypothetical protein